MQNSLKSVDLQESLTDHYVLCQIGNKPNDYEGDKNMPDTDDSTTNNHSRKEWLVWLKLILIVFVPPIILAYFLIHAFYDLIGDRCAPYGLCVSDMSIYARTVASCWLGMWLRKFIHD